MRPPTGRARRACKQAGLRPPARELRGMSLSTLGSLLEPVPRRRSRLSFARRRRATVIDLRRSLVQPRRRRLLPFG